MNTQAQASDSSPWRPDPVHRTVQAEVRGEPSARTIEQIVGDGNLRVRLDSGRTIAFRIREHPHLDYGYALTSHSAQGATADRVLIHVDSASTHRDLINSRLAYVAVSRARYDARIHHIVRGHIAARSSDDVLRQLAGQLKQRKIEYAATGLAAAWLLTQFAGFRLVVFYVGQLPPVEARREMGFHEAQRGENVWLVVPNDEGVLHGAADRDGIRHVHPVQVYLDLKNHPERSAEAAEQLRLDANLSGARAAGSG